MSQADPNNPANQGEDIVDTIAQYDLDEDFPDYANEQNKELNQIVSQHSLKRRWFQRKLICNRSNLNSHETILTTLCRSGRKSGSLLSLV